VAYSRQADTLQGFMRRRFCGFTGNASIEQGQRQVVQQGRHKKLIFRVLKDDADTAHRLSRPFLSEQAHIPFGVQEAKGTPKQGALSSPICADQAHLLTLFDVQRYFGQDGLFPIKGEG
jgi:hypothetical protein